MRRYQETYYIIETPRCPEYYMPLDSMLTLIGEYKIVNIHKRQLPLIKVRQSLIQIASRTGIYGKHQSFFCKCSLSSANRDN